YNQDFLDMVFKRHHFSGIISIGFAFIFLIVVGFFMDDAIFEVPAAASILIFFAALMAVIGALTYFLQSWSLPFFILLIFSIDILYQNEIIDTRNKAYGLNYKNEQERPDYNKQALQQLCLPANIAADKANMITILENWKKKQKGEKPVMVFINVSGGGLRSGTFVMNTLQQLDSATTGKLLQHTMLISGASGGMLAATYYRELYNQKQKGQAVNLYDKAYSDNIAEDLLNPVFSSMIARDIFSPAQKFSVGDFKYVKDRGYAFEQKLGKNSRGVLNRQLKDYSVEEKAASIPLMIFNSTISRDGRRMMISTQPISFMMKPFLYANDPAASPDAVDFAAMFVKQDPLNIRLLTALRMNATFPYVLPNVWLPSNPVIDVMDAGWRDNFGQETTLRFIDHFREWMKANTGGVLIIQIRDRTQDNWQQPFEAGSVTDIIIKPATMLQHNWFKLQDFSENDQYSYMHAATDSALHRIAFMYVPEEEQKGAALNFHLTAREKRDVKTSFKNEYNQASMKKVKELLK
ncbi:MAG TPA: patatin-like phospholipase family protein, partial [Ferruginibacter sp.]|nr:patatin-like phospholipase family protein [Ferruginibacter sp.]